MSASKKKLQKPDEVSTPSHKFPGKLIKNEDIKRVSSNRNLFDSCKESGQNEDMQKPSKMHESLQIIPAPKFENEEACEMPTIDKTQQDDFTKMAIMFTNEKILPQAKKQKNKDHPSKRLSELSKFAPHN